jgi:hypothetical protein
VQITILRLRITVSSLLFFLSGAGLRLELARRVCGEPSLKVSVLRKQRPGRRRSSLAYRNQIRAPFIHGMRINRMA